MPEKVKLPILPSEGIFFSLRDIAYPPTVQMNEPFTVTGKVDLFGIPFLAPVWVIITVTYPETLWEQIIPIIGAPEVRESSMVVGSDFEMTFKKGFLREGEFGLAVRVYPGPTVPIDSIVIPPVPAFATEETTFMVAGEAPPAGFRNLSILSYGKNSGTPVTKPGVLELEVGDICRVNFSFEHRGDAESGRLYAAIGNYGAAGFDEIIANDKSISVPSSTDWETIEKYVDIPITTAISPGSGYDLYGKIVDIPGADIFSSYLEDVITITGVPVKGEFRNFGITGWTPDPAVLSIGDSLTITHHFEYKGPRYTTADIHSAIGTRGWAGFDEILAKSVSHGTFGPDEDWMGYDVEVTIPITTAISPGVDYDLYSKLTDIPGADLYDYKDNIIEIVETLINFSLSKPSASPSHVDPGDSVTIRCPITSLCTKSQTITVKAKIYEGSALPGHGDKLDELSKTTTIPPGQTKDVTFYHTAIGTDAERRDVEVEIYVGGTLIVQDEWDDIYYVSIAPPPPPEYKGTISQKQLKYNGTIRSIPVSSVPQDKSGIVSIWGRNDMSSNQKMGIWWQVKDPDGQVVEEYSRWEAYWTGPGNAQEFIGGRFDLDKAGTYTIGVELFMNPDDQVCVDDYHGTLCTVAGAPPPTAVTFDVMIWGTGGFGHYDKWMCFYYDPATGGFVGDDNWHYPSQDIGFSNVEPGGYLAVFLLEDSTMSGQFTSPTFQAVDGGRYQYDLDLNRVGKIG